MQSIHDIAIECINGKYGNGNVRRTILKKMGYDPVIVQNEINKIIQINRKKTNEEIIWDYLMVKIENPFGVAGMMGNLRAESGLNPKNLQNSSEKRLNFTDESYTKAVDNGTYKNFATDNAGYGLAQWTSSGRKKALLESKGKASIGDLNVQLDYLWKELSTSYKSVLERLKTASSVREASNIVLSKFERPKDQSEAVQTKRISYSQEYFDRFTGGKV